MFNQSIPLQLLSSLPNNFHAARGARVSGRQPSPPSLTEPTASPPPLGPQQLSPRRLPDPSSIPASAVYGTSSTHHTPWHGNRRCVRWGEAHAAPDTMLGAYLSTVMAGVEAMSQEQRQSKLYSNEWGKCYISHFRCNTRCKNA